MRRYLALMLHCAKFWESLMDCAAEEGPDCEGKVAFAIQQARIVRERYTVATKLWTPALHTAMTNLPTATTTSTSRDSTSATSTSSTIPLDAQSTPPPLATSLLMTTESLTQLALGQVLLAEGELSSTSSTQSRLQSSRPCRTTGHLKRSYGMVELDEDSASSDGEWEQANTTDSSSSDDDDNL
jgi:hypothetical protein